MPRVQTDEEMAMTYGWEKDQAENQRQEEIRRRAEEDKRMQRNAQSGFDSRSKDHATYDGAYRKA